MWKPLPDTFLNKDTIKSKFEALREKNEGTLVAYLTGGDPNPEAFRANCTALVEGGADILEVGIPFSDPIADGPVIQAANLRSLSNGSTTASILGDIRTLSSLLRVPIVVLTYYNTVLAVSADQFLKRASESGANGIVIPDLPLEEARDFADLATKHSVDTILLAAPNTSKDRLERILETSRGFLYLVSLYGVTGPRESLSTSALETVKRVKEQAAGRIPVSAGFGVSTPEHVSSILASGADGAIVGSALVKIVSAHLNDTAAAGDQLRKTVAMLKAATRRK